MLKRLNELESPPLLRQIGGLLQLVVLLLQAVVELGQLDLHVVLDVLLLVADDLEDFVFELLLSLDLQLLKFVEH